MAKTTNATTDAHAEARAARVNRARTMEALRVLDFDAMWDAGLVAWDDHDMPV